jgi:8-oxo-dGTP pyrophosphatase MutT (NUDIX family)
LQLTSELRTRISENLTTRRPELLVAPDARRAAVGVVLVPDELGRACFLLTRRAETLRRHSGQWALPGGRLEPGESEEDAARREIREEVGLDLSNGAVLGRLDDFLSRSGHLISPFVLWSDSSQGLKADPTEVSAVYRVPLSELDMPGNPRREPLLRFALIGTTVFAPTAAILFQFRELALHGRHVHVSGEEQPHFAWR